MSAIKGRNVLKIEEKPKIVFVPNVDETIKDKLYSIDPFQKIQWDKFGLIVANEVIKEQKLTSKNHEWIGDYSGTFFEKTNETFDLVFIDGDHSEEASYNDFWMYYPLVKKYGIFAGHDIVLESVKKSLEKYLGEDFSKVITVSNNAWYIVKE